MMATHYGKSSSGMIHHRLGSMAVACSSGNRGMRNIPIDEKKVTAAKPESFCKKCFPNGKPQQLIQ
ncbi:hypothetical protein [Serratia fonticola]